MFPSQRIIRSKERKLSSAYNVHILVVAQNADEFLDWANGSLGGVNKVHSTSLFVECGRVRYRAFLMGEVANSSKWRGHTWDHVVFLGDAKLSEANACIIQASIRA